MGAFPKFSRNVPFCLRLSASILYAAQNGDNSGQKRTNGDKTGLSGQFVNRRTSGSTPVSSSQTSQHLSFVVSQGKRIDNVSCGCAGLFSVFLWEADTNEFLGCRKGCNCAKHLFLLHRGDPCSTSLAILAMHYVWFAAAPGQML